MPHRKAERRLLAVFVGVLLTACASSAALPTAEPTSQPATPRPTPEPETEQAWPAEFDEDLCLAIDQLGQATEDIAEMRQAAELGDIERTSLMAYAAGGYALTVQAILSGMPSWEPGNPAVASLSGVTDNLVAGLDLIDLGAQEFDGAKINEGAALVGAAGDALAAETTPVLADLRAEHGLTC